MQKRLERNFIKGGERVEVAGSERVFQGSKNT